MSQDCERFDAFVGGQLEEAEAAAYERHLRGCPTCQAELSLQARLEELLVRARDHLEPVPDELVRRIERRLPSTSPRRIVIRWSAGWLGAAAALAVVILVPIWRVPLPGTASRQRSDAHALAARQAALGELAVLVGGARRHPSEKDPMWVRPVRIASPVVHIISGRSGPRRDSRLEMELAALESEPVTVLRGPPPFRARAIASRPSLGLRRVRDGVHSPSGSSPLNRRDRNDL